jgi:Cu(I)/Ag(I) efflux system membrane fusion protein/cobalt-zinc-cadmium efflux system membrane fusion protein
MHPQVIQDHPGQCPICHMELTPLDVDVSAGDGEAPVDAPSGERKVKYWWDPMMSPPYISDKPGKSPMGMDLVPVYEGEAPGGTAITIDPSVVQNMGVQTETVAEGPLVRTVRAAGVVAEAEPNIREVNLLVSGWIRRLHADTVGIHVAKGAPLFDLYSPEVYAAIEELIRLRRSVPDGAQEPDTAGRPASLHEAAARRLELWGLTSAQVGRLAKLKRAPRTVTFTSPIDGAVTEKNVVEGSAVRAGDAALRIVDHREVWIDAKVFEQHLAGVSIGQGVTATVKSFPGATFAGKVVFIHPHVDPDTRTAIVRLSVENRALRLRPGMYATVELRSELAARAALVPTEAVIDTGVRKVAFVALGDGHFVAREVETGRSDAEGRVEVLAGLAVGERVVTSGQFLLDSESRLREAVQKFLREREGKPVEPAPPAPVPTAKEPDPQHGNSDAPTPTPVPADTPKTSRPPRPASDADVDATSSTPGGAPEPSPPTYTCPMHPQVHQDGPGPCPICGMDLVPSEAGQ